MGNPEIDEAVYNARWWGHDRIGDENAAANAIAGRGMLGVMLGAEVGQAEVRSPPNATSVWISSLIRLGRVLKWSTDEGRYCGPGFDIVMEGISKRGVLIVY